MKSSPKKLGELCFFAVKNELNSIKCGVGYFASQPSADAPNTAASASLSSDTRILTLFLKIPIMFLSKELRRGFKSKSPDFANPPNKMNA